MANDSSFLYGTLNLLILKTLSLEPAHGLEVARRIRRMANEELTVEEGALYPALHRLERQGLLESHWGISDRNRKAKFYGLTGTGRSRLSSEESGWLNHVRAVCRVLEVEWAPIE